MEEYRYRNIVIKLIFSLNKLKKREEEKPRKKREREKV